MARLRIQVQSKPALLITWRALVAKRLAYIAVADRPVRYRAGSTPIVYIGTTRKGARRVAQSAVETAKDAMQKRGINKVRMFIVTCGTRPNVASWNRLEDALIAAFRHRYEAMPLCNQRGKRLKLDKFERLFSRSRLLSIIDSFKKRHKAPKMF